MDSYWLEVIDHGLLLELPSKLSLSISLVQVFLNGRLIFDRNLGFLWSCAKLDWLGLRLYWLGLPCRDGKSGIHWDRSWLGTCWLFCSVVFDRGLLMNLGLAGLLEWEVSLLVLGRGLKARLLEFFLISSTLTLSETSLLSQKLVDTVLLFWWWLLQPSQGNLLDLLYIVIVRI